MARLPTSWRLQQQRQSLTRHPQLMHQVLKPGLLLLGRNSCSKLAVPRLGCRPCLAYQLAAVAMVALLQHSRAGGVQCSGHGRSRQGMGVELSRGAGMQQAQLSRAQCQTAQGQ